MKASTACISTVNTLRYTTIIDIVDVASKFHFMIIGEALSPSYHDFLFRKDRKIKAIIINCIFNHECTCTNCTRGTVNQFGRKKQKRKKL